MKKCILISILASVIFLTTCDYCPERNDEKVWTILLYVDEDFFPSFGRFKHIRTNLCSNDLINVVIIEDQNTKPANYWYIDKEYELVLLEELGEVNMGDSKTLSDFIKFSKRNYPAEKYLLALSNHGGGWIGACWDQSHNNDWLSPYEIEAAIENNGGVDIMMMIACSMGSIETAYQVSNLTDIYIGSANPTGYEYFGRVWDKTVSLLMDSNNLSNKEIGNRIVDEIWNKAVEMSAYEENLTFSSINSGKLDELVGKIDIISQIYLEDFEHFQNNIDTIINNINYHRNDAVDLYDLIRSLKIIESDQNIKSELSELLNYFDEVILNEHHGENAHFSNGLSIYFPNPYENYYNELYSNGTFNLRLASDTHWDELIRKYFEDTGQQTIFKIPEIPLPE